MAIACSSRDLPWNAVYRKTASREPCVAVHPAQLADVVFCRVELRVVKHGAASPLLPTVLRGIATFAHKVNVELLLDLFTNMRGLLRPDAGLSPPDALHCVHALLRRLLG